MFCRMGDRKDDVTEKIALLSKERGAVPAGAGGAAGRVPAGRLPVGEWGGGSLHGKSEMFE